jgi:hypothetical protein
MRGRHVRSRSRRSAAAGAVSRAVGLTRGSARCAPGQRTHLGDRLHQPKPDVRAAALAGLAITPLPASAVIAGLRILEADEGLPRLPDLEFTIYEKARPDNAAAALAAALLALAQGPSRPTI